MFKNPFKQPSATAAERELERIRRHRKRLWPHAGPWPPVTMLKWLTTKTRNSGHNRRIY
jgi:hypothetical protein